MSAFNRRSAIFGGFSLAACAPRPPRVRPEPNRDRQLRFFSAIHTLEARIGGRIGVAALNTPNGAWLSHRADERFAMCSTFKWLLAAQHLQMNQETPGWLDEVAMFGAGDLQDYAPVARQHLARGAMSNQEMCAGAVVMSDNTCANLLLIPVGGPQGFTDFLRVHGDAVTRLDRNEPTLNENLPGDARDTTTPYAMAQTLQRFLTTDAVLNAGSREMLIGWMVESPTGRERLRAGLPRDWRVGDKTGTWTGEHNATNDVAIALPPGRGPIVIACYLSGSIVELPERNAAHAEAARIVAAAWA
jgi:beta-lactamase class A